MRGFYTLGREVKTTACTSSNTISSGERNTDTNTSRDYVKKEFLENLYKTIKKYPTLNSNTINTDEDHVHLHIEIPPNMTIAAVVQLCKGVSSMHLKKRFKFIQELYLDGSIGSVRYFVSTIGLNEEMIKKYITHQGKKDFPKMSKLF